LIHAVYDWQEILDKYGANLLLVDRKHKLPLIEAVSQSGDWREVYCDEQSLTFVSNWGVTNTLSNR